MKRAMLCLLLCGLVLAGFSCASSVKPSPSAPQANAQQPPAVSRPPQANAQDLVTIMAPKDEAAFVNAINLNGPDPKVAASFLPFVAKRVPAVGVEPDPTSAALQAAASELHAGPTGADKVVYFKVVDTTAYVLLEMDVNGWAGVSYAIAKVHPLAEQTLLQFPGITKVVFGVAPGDNIQNVIKTLGP